MRRIDIYVHDHRDAEPPKWNLEGGRRLFESLPKGPAKPRVKNTPEQKRALEEYERCLREEDRLANSVFANSVNMRAKEAKTREAYERCKALGMGPEHGL